MFHPLNHDFWRQCQLVLSELLLPDGMLVAKLADPHRKRNVTASGIIGNDGRHSGLGTVNVVLCMNRFSPMYITLNIIKGPTSVPLTFTSQFRIASSYHYNAVLSLCSPSSCVDVQQQTAISS